VSSERLNTRAIKLAGHRFHVLRLKYSVVLFQNHTFGKSNGSEQPPFSQIQLTNEPRFAIKHRAIFRTQNKMATHGNSPTFP
jgi:hypothetical protein